MSLDDIGSRRMLLYSIASFIVFRAMDIAANTEDGRTAFLVVFSGERISEVKKKIEKIISVLPCKQILVFHDTILQDDQTVGDYQITDGSVINVVDQIR